MERRSGASAQRLASRFLTSSHPGRPSYANGRFEAFVSGITPINLFYVGRKNPGATVVRQSVTELLIAVQVCPIDRAILRAAEQLPFSDYEDAVQHASATTSGVEAIVTRNLNHYKNATIPIFSPAGFLAQLPQ